MNEISKVKIADIGITVTGKTPSSNNPEDFGSEFMFVTPSDSFDSKMMISTERYLSSDGVSKLKNKLLPPKSIMITCIGSAMGKVSMNKTNCITNQQINSIVPNKNHYPDYIYYSIKNNYKLLRNASTGSTALPLLNKTDFDLLELPIHSNKITQQKIASVLTALDSKIELNNRINAELEAMAKTIYDYWFVQFDFPDQNGKPYKANGGKMVWNEELKREIPEGWCVEKMEDWLNIDKSGDWGKDSPEGNFTKKVICFRGADINGLNGFGELKPPVRFINEKNSYKILNSHDLIIEISGGSPTQSTGRMAFITDATIKRFELPLICSNFCKPISMKNKKLLYNFVYYWNSLYDNGVFFGYEGKTSGIKNLLFDSFISSYSTVVPEAKVVEKFYSLMESIQEKKQTALAENQKLAELRDWLLPMLMNGQVKIKEAKEYIQSPNNLSMAAEPEVGYGE
jgi:type I restriction enzyme S subunit